MMKMLRYTFTAAVLFGLFSCKYFKKQQAASENNAIARVGDDYLYASDLKNATRGLSGKDSVNALSDYAKDWVKKQLLLQKATENISDDDVGITKKVEKYRETLLLYEYEKALINQKLDTVISDADMNAQYEKVKADFPLENDVYRVNFIKVKKDAPDLNTARKWILKPKGEEDIRKMEGYSQEVAVSSSLGEGMWYEKENALKTFPLTASDLTSLADSKKFKEYKTDDGVWFIRINESLKSGATSPLDLIKDRIVRIILEQRKMLLLERIYNRIYQDGKESKSFDIYVAK